MAAGCLLETSDGYYIVGELAKNTSFPHCMQISGGNADYNDVQNGEINIFNTIFRECKEELNVNLQDKNQVENYEIKYISVPSQEVHFIKKGKTTEELNKLNNPKRDYLEKLLEIDSIEN